MFPFPRDTLTKFHTKGILLSEEGTAKISKEIPGKKLLCIFDFNHMGLPNKFGLRRRLNDFLSIFPEIQKKVFDDFPQEIVRFGGDEFCIIIPDEAAAISKLKLFFTELEKQRKKFLPEADEKVKLVMQFAKIRSLMRKLRSDFLIICKQKKKDFDLEGFVAFLKAKLEHEKLTEEVISQKFRLEQRIGFMQKQLALGHAKNEKESVVVPSGIIFEIDEKLTPRDILNAFFQSDEIISQRQRAGVRDIDFTPITLKKESLAREALFELQNWQEYESEYLSLKKQLETASPQEKEELQQKIRFLQWSDPVVQGVFRLNLCAGAKIREIFPIKKPTEYQALIFRLSGFGAINNNLGYEMADQIFRSMTEIAQEYFPKAVFMRSNGGKLTVFLPVKDFSESVFETVCTRINTIIKTNLSDVRVIAEVSEKRALETLLPKNKDKMTPVEWRFGEVIVDGGRIIIDPEKIIAEI